MKYCKSCILPDTRPGVILLEDDVCKACKNHNKKTCEIDWAARKVLFEKVVDNAKSRSNGYDCLIPVSGGKDSTWQVIKCLEYGLNPLAFTWKTPARTPLGQENLDNLVELGVDHIDYQVNPKVEKKFMLESLKKYGSSAIPMHMAIFNISLQIAVNFSIPLVVWGENSAFEYGSSDDELTGFKLDKKWLDKFGVTHGTTAEDWISENLSRKELTPYFGPTQEQLEEKNINAVFLGYYFPWDVETSLKVALQHGFKVREEGARTGFYNYADIDDDFISIHHYLKWYKFGMTRTFDNLSIEIRNGRVTRQQAIEILKERGSERPQQDIEKFCTFAGISEDELNHIIEKFRNTQIWQQQDGIWKINDFFIDDWNWNES